MPMDSMPRRDLRLLQLDVFTTSGTWRKHPRVKRIEYFLLGAGRGGRGGPASKDTSGGQSSWPGTGGSALIGHVFMPHVIAAIPDEVTVTVAAGGTGGAGALVTSGSGLTAGQYGTGGGHAIFWAMTSQAQDPPYTNNPVFGLYDSFSGHSGGTTKYLAGSHGGDGGSVTTSPPGTPGQTGGGLYGGAGGSAGGGHGGNAPPDRNSGGGGGGGNTGSSSSAIVGGNGGNGGLGSGGGGGGGAFNSGSGAAQGGTGGNGGPGIVVIAQYG